MGSKGGIKGCPHPQRAVGLSDNPDPAVCGRLCTVGLEPVLRFGSPGSSLAVPVLWHCRREEQGRREGDWQVSLAYLFSAFGWKYWLAILGENWGNRHPNCVENPHSFNFCLLTLVPAERNIFLYIGFLSLSREVLLCTSSRQEALWRG